MRTLLVICAFSASLFPVFCQPSWEYESKPNLRHELKPSLLHESKPNLLHESKPNLLHGAHHSHHPVKPAHPLVVPLIHGTAASDAFFYYNSQLFFIDAIDHELCAYHESNRELVCTYTGHDFLSFALPVANNLHHFVFGYKDKIILVNWDTSKNSPNERLLTFPDVKLEKNEVINHGITDPFGGICFWTMKMHAPYGGKVFSYHPFSPPPHLIKQVLAGIDVSNGIVWHIHEPTILYSIDGMKNRILKYTYNVAERRIIGLAGIAFDLDLWNRLERHPLYNGHAILGRLTIDTKGRLWVPLHGGSHVLQIDPNTEIVLKSIHIPAVMVTACVFGGTDLNILYASTLPCAVHENCPADDQGGKLFAIHNLDKDVMGQNAMAFVMPKEHQ